MAQQLKLRWYSEGHPQERLIPMDSQTLVGRGDNADLILPDPHVSRQHASILGKGGRFMLTNLSQSNPVFLKEGSTLHQLRYQESRLLQAGQLILIGKSELQIDAIDTISAISDAPAKEDITLRVRCSNCQRVVDAKNKDCPWCGTALAFGNTFSG